MTYDLRLTSSMMQRIDALARSARGIHWTTKALLMDCLRGGF